MTVPSKLTLLRDDDLYRLRQIARLAYRSNLEREDLVRFAEEVEEVLCDYHAYRARNP